MKNVIVFTTWDEPIADMALNFLHDAGIPALKTGEVPRSVMPFTMDGLGEIAIRVPETDIENALEIIAVRFSEIDIDPFVPRDNDAGIPGEPGESDDTP